MSTLSIESGPNRLVCRRPQLQDTVQPTRYPELIGHQEADVIVVGAGIVGIAHALLLAELGCQVVIVDQGRIGLGTTQEQARMITRAFDEPFDRLADRYGIEKLKQLFQISNLAQKSLYSYIGRHRLDCDFLHCHSDFGAYRSNEQSLRSMWSAIKGIDEGTVLLTGKKASVAYERFAELIRFRNEGTYNVLKFINESLKRKKARRFIRVFEQSQVTDVSVSRSQVTVSTERGDVRAPHCVIATGSPGLLTEEFTEIFHPVFQDSTVSAVVRYDEPHGYRTNINRFDTPYVNCWRAIDPRTLHVTGMGLCPEKETWNDGDDPLEALLRFVDSYLGRGYEVTHTWSSRETRKPIIDTKDGLMVAGPHPYFPRQVTLSLGAGGTGNVNAFIAANVNVGRIFFGEENPFGQLFDINRFA
jgi:glycine/D-amino acid oxidase-like deaminating enzyme